MVLRSIRRCRKILPGGTTLQANASLPMRESRSLFCAGVSLVYVMYGVEDLLFAFLGDGGLHGRGVELYPEEGQYRGGAFFFLRFCWGIDVLTELVHHGHVLTTDWRVWGASCKEIIQIVDDVVDAIVVVEDPLNG